MVGWLLVVGVCAWAKQSDDVCCGDAEGADGDDDGVGIITMADGDTNDVADGDCRVHTC